MVDQHGRSLPLGLGRGPLARSIRTFGAALPGLWRPETRLQPSPARPLGFIRNERSEVNHRRFIASAIAATLFQTPLMPRGSMNASPGFMLPDPACSSIAALLARQC